MRQLYILLIIIQSILCQSTLKLLQFVMGKAQSKPEDCRREEFAKARKIIQREGVTGAQRIIREKLEELKNVEIKFGVTGTAGVGKSSFINSIRGYGNL